MRTTRIPVTRSSKVTLCQESIIKKPIGPAARRNVRKIEQERDRFASTRRAKTQSKNHLADRPAFP